MQVVDVDLVLHGARAELVGRAVGRAALHAAAGHPGAEAAAVVIAAGVVVAIAVARRPCGRTRRPR